VSEPPLALNVLLLGTTSTLSIADQRLRRRIFPPFLPFSPQPHASPREGAPLRLSVACEGPCFTVAPVQTRQSSSEGPLHDPFFLLFLLLLLPSRRPSAGPACIFSSDSQTLQQRPHRLQSPFHQLLAHLYPSNNTLITRFTSPLSTPAPSSAHPTPHTTIKMRGETTEGAS
jgi:hypothetical protein